ncbi:hypothetical protein ACLK19_01250 [Escherichia coli]
MNYEINLLLARQMVVIGHHEAKFPNRQKSSRLFAAVLAGQRDKLKERFAVRIGSAKTLLGFNSKMATVRAGDWGCGGCHLLCVSRAQDQTE